MKLIGISVGVLGLAVSCLWGIYFHQAIIAWVGAFVSGVVGRRIMDQST